jgi:hypothetical protein
MHLPFFLEPYHFSRRSDAIRGKLWLVIVGWGYRKVRRKPLRRFFRGR